MKGRHKIYTPTTLETAVRRYFKSISREKTVTESVPTDKKDEKGHIIFKTQPITNRLGKEMKTIEYIVPPSLAGLCAYLHIHRSTWNNYCEQEEYQEITGFVYEELKAWNENELLVRSGKDVKGIIFNLENNYDYRERKSVDLGGEGVEAYLQRLRDSGEGAQEF